MGLDEKRGNIMRRSRDERRSQNIVSRTSPSPLSRPATWDAVERGSQAVSGRKQERIEGVLTRGRVLPKRKPNKHPPPKSLLFLLDRVNIPLLFKHLAVLCKVLLVCEVVVVAHVNLALECGDKGRLCLAKGREGERGEERLSLKLYEV